VEIIRSEIEQKNMAQKEPNLFVIKEATGGGIYGTKKNKKPFCVLKLVEKEKFRRGGFPQGKMTPDPMESEVRDMMENKGGATA